MVKTTHPISKVEGVMNAVSVVGDAVGQTMFYGAGAGGDATASAVIADIIEIARGNSSPMLGYKRGLERGLKLLEPSNIKSRYYLKLKVTDKSGVLASVAKSLSEFGISISSVLQKESKVENRVRLILTTHSCQESEIKQAIAKLQELECVDSNIGMMRIEE